MVHECAVLVQPVDNLYNFGLWISVDKWCKLLIYKGKIFSWGLVRELAWLLLYIMQVIMPDTSGESKMIDFKLLAAQAAVALCVILAYALACN